MKFTDKIKENMSPEDLAKFEGAVSKLISEKVDQKVAVLVEEARVKIEDEAAKEAAQIIQEKVEESKKTLNEHYTKEMEKLETKLVENLDQFLESEINGQISDKVLSEVALNETYKPIVEGIKNIFENKFISLDTEGHGLIREAKEEIESLEKKQSEIIAEKMEITSELNKVKADKLILEKTEGMNVDQKKRVTTLLEGKDLEEVTKKIDSIVEVVLEHKEETKADKTNVNQDVIAENDDAGQDVDPTKVDSMTDTAGKFL